MQIGVTLERCKTLKYILSVITVLIPILNQYNLFPLMVMDVFAFLGVIVCLFCVKSVAKIKPAVFLFVFFLIIDTLLISLLTDGVNSIDVYIRMCRVLVIYAFFFWIIPDLFDFDYAFQFYTKVVFLISVVVILQFICYLVFGVDINLLIPGLKINYGTNLTSDMLMNKWHIGATIGYYRPCSFFLEPAYHAQYCLPWLAIALAYNPWNNEKKWSYVMIVVSLGLVMTTSTLGVLGCALLWIYNIISNSNDSSKAKQIFIMLPIFIVLIVFVLTQNSINQQVLGKMDSLSTGESASTSLRLLRGFACFNQMDVLYKFFGCGYGNIAVFIQEHNITTIYDHGTMVKDYMNGVSTVLCGLGFLGLMLYVYMMLSVSSINKSDIRYILLFTLLIIMLTSAIFGTATYFLLTSFIQTRPKKCYAINIKQFSQRCTIF